MEHLVSLIYLRPASVLSAQVVSCTTVSCYYVVLFLLLFCGVYAHGKTFFTVHHHARLTVYRWVVLYDLVVYISAERGKFCQEPL